MIGYEASGKKLSEMWWALQPCIDYVMKLFAKKTCSWLQSFSWSVVCDSTSYVGGDEALWGESDKLLD